MTIDNDLMLRDGTVSLEASEATPTAKDFSGEDLMPMFYHVDVPAVSGTTPTMLVELQGSETEGGTYTTFATFESITAAGHYIKQAITEFRWRRAKITLGGTTPNFGAAMVYPEPAGRYNEK